MIYLYIIVLFNFNLLVAEVITEADVLPNELVYIIFVLKLFINL